MSSTVTTSAADSVKTREREMLFLKSENKAIAKCVDAQNKTKQNEARKHFLIKSLKEVFNQRSSFLSNFWFLLSSLWTLFPRANFEITVCSNNTIC